MNVFKVHLAFIDNEKKSFLFCPSKEEVSIMSWTEDFNCFENKGSIVQFYVSRIKIINRILLFTCDCRLINVHHSLENTPIIICSINVLSQIVEPCTK